MKRIEAAQPRSGALKNGILALTALAGFFGSYELSQGAMAAHHAFDFTNDGVFHDSQFPGIGNMVLINNASADTVFNAARDAGFNSTLATEGILLGAAMTAKLATNLSPMKESAKRSVNSTINLALLTLGTADLAYGLHDGGITNPHGRFDLTNDGVFHNPQFPYISNMVLINNASVDTVFNAAAQTGADQALGLAGAGFIALEAAQVAPRVLGKRRRVAAR